MVRVPTFDHYIVPTLAALKQLGGSASTQELFEHVTEAMGLSDEQLAVLHDPERGQTTEVAYRMAWARSYLRKIGYVETSRRGVWALTQSGREAKDVDPKDVLRRVRATYPRGEASKKKREGQEDVEPHQDEEGTGGIDWRASLLDVLHHVPAAAFERLCQRILRETGFLEVTVKGRSGDGGIDGTGILRLQELVSFHVLFQCKRWKGTVGPGEIRDFRGAMVGRSDKGLFLTTGTFSRDAQKEATRDGAPPIDLIDGEQLCELLRRLGLGVKTEQVEVVSVVPDWFSSL